MKITLVSPADSWMNNWIESWLPQLTAHHVAWVHRVADIESGDVAFLLSLDQIVPEALLARHRNNIVVHASALPEGRGWSPLTWQILAGSNTIPLTLFEAVAAVDAGPIYLRDTVQFEGHELVGELRGRLGAAVVALCSRFIDAWPGIVASGEVQQGDGSVYQRRRPADSALDVNQSIASQFNLLRVADNDRYPAYFDHKGYRYLLKIEKDAKGKGKASHDE